MTRTLAIAGTSSARPGCAVLGVTHPGYEVILLLVSDGVVQFRPTTPCCGNDAV